MATCESDEIREMYCEPCFKDGIKHTKAVGFCSTCVEYMCVTCVRYHRKYMPEHALKDEEDMPKDYCFDLCSLHSVEVIKFYCMTCENTACARCKVDQHSNCADIHHLADIVVDFERSPELEVLEKKIMKSKSTLQRLKRTIAKGEKHTELLRSGAARTLERQRENMILQFDHFAEEIKSTTSKIHDDDGAKLQEKLNEADTVNDELISMETDLCNMKKAQQRCKLFIKAKEADHEVDKIGIKLENLKYGVGVNEYSYYPIENCRERPLGSLRIGKEQKLTDEAVALTIRVILELRMACQILKEFLSSWKYFLLFVILLLAVLGIKVNMVYMLFLIITFVPLSMLRTNSWVDSYLPVGYDLAKWLLVTCINVTILTYKSLHFDNVKHWYLFCSLNEWYKQIPSTYISVKTKDNVTCNITGICFLSPIHLAAVDNNNSTVKLFDIEQEKVITELLMGGKLPFDHPWDVTKISSDQLAVTVPHSKTICFLQLTCCFGIDLISLSIARTVPVNCLCYGIVYHNNKLIISVAGDPCSVRMLDLDGNVLQRFNEDREGEKLFPLPYYVILSKTCNSLYVSSYGNGNVTRMSMDGTVLAVYKHEQLKDVFGMTIDKAGKVYVLGYNNIFQLSEDLTEGHQVLVNNRMNNNIAYCEKTNSFWLAFHDQDYILNISV